IYWPTRRNGELYWGYVVFDGSPSLISTAAPYVVDILLVLVSTWACVRWLSTRRALWINVAVFGVVAPTIDLTSNFIMLAVFRRGGDVAGLTMALGFVAVDVSFFLAFLTCAACFEVVFGGNTSGLLDRRATALRMPAAWFWLMGINATVLVGEIAIRGLVGV